MTYISSCAAECQGFSQDDFCIGPCPCKFEVGIEGKINGEAEKTILDEKQKKLRQKFRPYTHNSEILLSPRLN